MQYPAQTIYIKRTNMKICDCFTEVDTVYISADIDTIDDYAHDLKEYDADKKTWENVRSIANPVNEEI